MAAGLQFSDTSNKNGIIQEIEFALNVGDGSISGNTLTGSDLKAFTRLVNHALHRVITWILQAQDEWEWDDISNTDFPIATTNLVANQQDYSLPASLNMLNIDRIEISFDGGTTWRRCQPFDKNETDEATNPTNVANNFSTNEPFYDIQFNSLFIYPIPTANSTAGLKIWYFRNAVEFVSTDTTKQPPLDAAYHRLIALLAAYDYAKSRRLAQTSDIKEDIEEMRGELARHYGSKDRDRRIVLGSIYDTNYGE